MRTARQRSQQASRFALTIAFLVRRFAVAEVELPFCQNQRIFVLDLNTLAGSDVPRCEIDEIAVVNPSSGVVYHPFAKLKERTSHKYGAHSGPWYLAEALKRSRLATDDMNEADIVFVDSYCHYMWWLGWTHLRERDSSENPSRWLISALQRVSESERFKKNGGSDFVFTDPHPGFALGPLGKPYWTLVCQIFKNSMHVISEKGQRNVCPDYWQMEKRLLTVPYVPNSPKDGQYAAWEAPLKPAQARRKLLYWSSHCKPYSVDSSGAIVNVGKKMRHDVATALGSSQGDVMVKCKEPELGGREGTFDESLAAMQDSRFCLVLPGDSASNRQLSEIMMAGCIPVFLGPPYHTMTFYNEVAYRATGLFYNISEYSSWQTQTMHWEIHPTERPANPQVPWFWVLEKEVYPQLQHIKTIPDVVTALRSIPQSTSDSLFQMMDSQRQLFVYYEYLTTRWTAVNAIVSRICLMAGNSQKATVSQALATTAAAAAAVKPSSTLGARSKDYALRMAELSILFGKDMS